jgi:hypothetical protein
MNALERMEIERACERLLDRVSRRPRSTSRSNGPRSSSSSPRICRLDVGRRDRGQSRRCGSGWRSARRLLRSRHVFSPQPPGRGDSTRDHAAPVITYLTLYGHLGATRASQFRSRRLRGARRASELPRGRVNVRTAAGWKVREPAVHNSRSGAPNSFPRFVSVPDRSTARSARGRCRFSRSLLVAIAGALSGIAQGGWCAREPGRRVAASSPTSSSSWRTISAMATSASTTTLGGRRSHHADPRSARRRKAVRFTRCAFARPRFFCVVLAGSRYATLTGRYAWRTRAPAWDAGALRSRL